MFIVAWSYRHGEGDWKLIDGRDAVDIFVNELVEDGVEECAIHVGEEEEDKEIA